MSNLNHIIFESTPKNSVRSRLEYAIKNRFPVSFYYKGPYGEVLHGRRIKVKLFVSGLTKKGNLAVGGYVQPPSVSKKGFNKHGFRTFLINRISYGSLNIYEDEQYNVKPPNYNEGDDFGFSVAYVKSDWGNQKQPKKDNLSPSNEKPPIDKLPEPIKKGKPSLIPIDTKRDVEVFNDLKSKIKIINNQKKLSPDDFETSVNDLYNKKVKDWGELQKKLNLNPNPGEGTRRKFEKESEIELFNILKQNNIEVVEDMDVDDVQNNLQEQIKRIKTLISF